jgi:hypothetical protein
MIITKEIPTDWRDLQDKVCKYLNQAGYQAETAKTIELVRGKVEVDVFAMTDEEMLKQFVCECKYWNAPVSQEKIHAFRTVVQDSGSMFGIFISKNGYQKGAIEAAKCSNVILKNWDGFIEMIAHKWLKNRFREILKIGAPLSVYTDILDVPVEKLSDGAKNQYISLQNKYLPHYMLIGGLEMGAYNPKDAIVIEGFQFDDFNSLFDYLKKVMSQGIKEFEELFAKNPIEDWKFDYSDRMRFESHITDYLTI